MNAPTQEGEVNLVFRQSNRRMETPDWFLTAVGNEPEHLDVDVDGCRIHVRAWGEPANPPLVLVHGGGADSAWWDHIGPFFTPTHRVIAPDLSGHGDSDTRSVYGWDMWAREVLAAADAASVSGTVRIAGHSIGGQVAATVALEYGNQVDSIVVIDSPLRGRDAEISRTIERCSPVAAQEIVLPYVSAHIVAQSLRKASNGRRWESGAGDVDGLLAEGVPEELEVMETMMAQMPCRVAYVHCEAGLVPPAMATQIQSIMQLRGPFIELALAGHHPMLDQPLPLIATLRTLLEVWSIT
ncbi:alpha/beta hydrolase fold protein [Mycolicibacterium rhodesiae JS60]|nr:alpha/beta hydrolase fold protein [Mycolicibacterium rhodesiae JS60]